MGAFVFRPAMRLLLVVVLPVVAGCRGTPPKPATVRALDLARFYRDRPAVASAAYDGRPVLLALTNPVADGSELHWHLTTEPFPAVVVCRFDADPPATAPVVWLVGTCRGRVDDGAAREFAGYTFHVLITDCRPAVPPTKSGP